MKLVRIVISKFGKIKDEEKDCVIKIMKECYERLKPHNVELVDLYLFERSSTVEAFLSKEYAEVGVTSAHFGELFFAIHDAWRGTPRITLCFERMRKLPKLVWMGGIRHEAGHSVLHGGLQYYLRSLPPALRELVDGFDLTLEYATNLLYLMSIAVKDYEVTRLLHERGYLRDQKAYAGYLLTISESDIASWKMAKGNPLAEILCLISYLKASGCAAPLLLDKACGSDIRRRLRESLTYLPKDYSAALMKVITEDFPRLGTNTFDNIDRAADFIAEKIIKPLLGSMTDYYVTR